MKRTLHISVAIAEGWKTDMNARYDFDIAQWTRKYPLAGFDADEADLLSDASPAWISYIEQFRKRVGKLQTGNPHRTVPVDAYVLKWGEPSRRNVTKLGGVPFRPRHLPWPMSRRKKEPLSFVAQFNFVKSRPLLPKLPGDVLLAFFNDCAAYPHDEMFPEPPYFEWHSASLTNPMRAGDVPNQELRWVWNCHGYRHRTVDFVDGERFVDDLLTLKDPKVGPREPTERGYRREYRFALRGRYAQLNTLKIGGIPLFGAPETGIILANRALRFLCTIPSLYGDGERVDGWDEGLIVYPGCMSWSDGGCVHLFLDHKGNVVPWYESDKLD